MAFNPSPQVAVARDAAQRMATIHGQRVPRCVVRMTMNGEATAVKTIPPRLVGMTLAQCAEALSVPLKTLRKWQADGRFPRGIKVGKRILIRAAAVEAWWERNERKARLEA